MHSMCIHNSLDAVRELDLAITGICEFARLWPDVNATLKFSIEQLNYNNKEGRMTLHMVMIELLARAVDPKYNIYSQDAYKIHARKMQKLIAVKGPTCLVCDVSIQDVDNIKLVDIYA